MFKHMKHILKTNMLNQIRICLPKVLILDDPVFLPLINIKQNKHAYELKSLRCLYKKY